VIGGWGVDALLGEQTRKHLDLDLSFDASDDGERKAVSALVDHGFGVVRREDLRPYDDAPLRLEARVVLSNAEGLLVDLHPATRDAASLERDLYAVGRIGGEEVRCLSVPAQLALHRGYELRDFDRDDLALLEERFGATFDWKRQIAAR
jgi:lincosamide nucleotidyltransferase A/C/D/E